MGIKKLICYGVVLAAAGFGMHKGCEYLEKKTEEFHAAQVDKLASLIQTDTEHMGLMKENQVSVGYINLIKQISDYRNITLRESMFMASGIALTNELTTHVADKPADYIGKNSFNSDAFTSSTGEYIAMTQNAIAKNEATEKKIDELVSDFLKSDKDKMDYFSDQEHFSSLQAVVKEVFGGYSDIKTRAQKTREHFTLCFSELNKAKADDPLVSKMGSSYKRYEASLVSYDKIISYKMKQLSDSLDFITTLRGESGGTP